MTMYRFICLFAALSSSGCQLDSQRGPGSPVGSEAVSEVSPSPPSPLVTTSWSVVQFGDEVAPTLESPAAIVKFWANGRLGGMLSCNGIGGAAGWTENGEFTNLDQPLISTLMGCSDDAERGRHFAERFWGKMREARRWKLVGENLEIWFEDGSSARLKQIQSTAN